MSSGVLYIVSGKKFVEEAQVSAKSVRAVIPDLHISICTDTPPESDIFDNIIPLPDNNLGRLAKIAHILDTPYERTLFLDSDTYACADFSEVFDMLDAFEFAGVHAPRRYPLSKYLPEATRIENVPIAFPEINGGVLLFRKTPLVESFIESWKAEFQKDLEINPSSPEQPSLRRALYNSRVQLAILPPEYNCRFIFPVGISREVKILHGRHPTLRKIAEDINESLLIRMFSIEAGLVIQGSNEKERRAKNRLRLFFKKITRRLIQVKRRILNL